MFCILSLRIPACIKPCRDKCYKLPYMFLIYIFPCLPDSRFENLHISCIIFQLMEIKIEPIELIIQNPSIHAQQDLDWDCKVANLPPKYYAFRSTLRPYSQYLCRRRVPLVVLTDKRFPYSFKRVHHGTLGNRLANRTKQFSPREFDDIGCPVQDLDLKPWCSENHFMKWSIVLRSILKRCARPAFFFFFFLLAGTLAQIAARASGERGSFFYRCLLFFDTKIIWI